MARGSKEKYSNKQKRQAEHIEEGYTKRGAPKKKAQRIAWATVNKESGGGMRGGRGRPKKSTKSSTQSKSKPKIAKTNKTKKKRPVGRPKGSKNKKK